MFGRDPEFSRLSNLALDRIISLKEIDKDFIKNTEYDFSEYFEDIIGVSKSHEDLPVIIHLLFTPEQAPYILTKPIHGSQKKLRNDSEGLLISIEVIPNRELFSLLLSFGERVKVVSPEIIQRRIIEVYQKALLGYSPGEEL